MKTVTEEEENKVQEEEESSKGHHLQPNKPDMETAAPASEMPPSAPPLRLQRRPSLFETVFQVLRRPSGPGSTRGSHANIDLRRASPDVSGAGELVAHSPSSSRSGSRSIIPSNHVSFRRPSGIVTFNPELMNAHQKRYIMGLLQNNNDSNPSIHEQQEPAKVKPKACNDGMDYFVTIMSAFYAKILFFLGVAFPVTEVVSNSVSARYYQGFYLFLHIGSLAFMAFMYITLLKDRAITQLLKSSFDVEKEDFEKFQKKFGRRKISSHVERYGSFYLRLGAVAFGIGSMVYSGLEFGQYFELKEDSDCQNIIQAFTPAVRMVLTLVQMQFIFLNSQQIEMARYRGIARFGLMHMVAANLCEWFYVIVEETKHEIIHVFEHQNHPGSAGDHRHQRSNDHDIFECHRSKVMGSLVQDASPFLFPCTIEYSLICAVITYEMWKTVNKAPEDHSDQKTHPSLHTSKSSDNLQKSAELFSVDCSSSHKGLFSGILILVITIISLIVFFVMYKDKEYHQLAAHGVHTWEISLYVITTVAVLLAGWQMRFLSFHMKERASGLGLDNILLVCAQAGIYIYCMFSSIASFFTDDIMSPGGLILEVMNLCQSTIQTLFILDATFRRSHTAELHREKPGRQVVMFLMVSNMALWLVNTLQKSRAEFRPKHSLFYGNWAWTIITHVSMPLAIFFRFHSTICLFEIWKIAYKFKNDRHQRITLIGNSE